MTGRVRYSGQVQAELPRWPNSGSRRWSDAEQSLFMRQVVVMWQAEIDPERIGRRTRPVGNVGRVRSAHDGSGSSLNLTWRCLAYVRSFPCCASDQVLFMRVRASRWAPTATSFEEEHVEVEQWPDAATRRVRCTRAARPVSPSYTQWRGITTLFMWGLINSPWPALDRLLSTLEPWWLVWWCLRAL
jgi:hypothetical protein